MPDSTGHRISTSVTHDFDLQPWEQFDETVSYRSTALRIDRIIATVVDGTLSRVSLHGANVLKSGSVGKVRSEILIWRKPDAHLAALLRSRGIPVQS